MILPGSSAGGRARALWPRRSLRTAVVWGVALAALALVAIAAVPTSRAAAAASFEIDAASVFGTDAGAPAGAVASCGAASRELTPAPGQLMPVPKEEPEPRWGYGGPCGGAPGSCP